MKFGENLKIIRKSKTISQEDLAEKLGVSRQSVSKWETGENYPSMQNIVCLCTIFKCKMNDLVHEDFIDLDFLDEEVKMNVVKLNEKEQASMKTFSKILSVFGRIGKIGMFIAIVCIIIGMIAIPIIFGKMEISDNGIVYNDSVFEVKETSKGIEIVLKDTNKVKVADFDKEDVDNIKSIVSTRNKYVTIGMLELGLLVLLVGAYLMSIFFKYLDKLFDNVYNGDTPFTLDNVSYIKKMSYIMIACIIISTIGKALIEGALIQDIIINVEMFSILEIIFLYAMSLIFEYGYRIQKDSKGKMYN